MNVLITGSDGNLGSAVAKRYLSAGHHVFGTMLPDRHRAELEEVPAFTRLEVDLMHEGPLSEQLTHLGVPIHIGVFTVGGFGMGSIETATLEDLDHMWKLNVHTAFVSTKALFGHMKQHGGGGRMVLVSSKPGLNPKLGSGVLPYTLTKAAIPALAEILNKEGKEHHIVTSVIAPSIIDTAINRKAMPDADPSKWVTPAQLAEVIYFATTEGGSILRDPILKLYGDS